MALTRDKEGERVENICTKFPCWFCENYKKYMGKEHEMPFDQHYLTACIAPRFLYAASAKNDTWADPVSEQLNCVEPSNIYEKMGLTGFVCDKIAEVGDMFHDGTIGYHLRAGAHYFSREDWQKVIKVYR